MFINDYSDIENQIKQDILDWAINWVEVPNNFYNNKFPVCPYAKKARLAGETDIQVYKLGSVRTFIKKTIEDLINNKQHKVLLLALPPRVQYYPGIRNYLGKLNSELLIPNDFFALMGSAVTSKSHYPGWLNSGPYCLIGINTLSMVLPAVKTLRDTGYYDNWSQEYYDAIVVKRQTMYNKYFKR